MNMSMSQSSKKRDTVLLVVNIRTLELIKAGDVTLLPIYRSDWSLHKFFDMVGFERRFKCITFRSGNLPGAETVTCEYGGVMVSRSNHYLRVGENPVRVFQGDLIIKINSVVTPITNH